MDKVWEDFFLKKGLGGGGDKLGTNLWGVFYMRELMIRSDHSDHWHEGKVSQMHSPVI